MKRCRKGDCTKGSEAGRQVFGPVLDPAGVHHASLGRKPPRFSDHSGVGVKPDNLLEEVGETKRHGAWPAANVEEPASAV
jgi:hypothetical protein